MNIGRNESAVAETPASWGPVERVIFQALNDVEDARAIGLVGLSEVKVIANALRDAGLVREEPDASVASLDETMADTAMGANWRKHLLTLNSDGETICDRCKWGESSLEPLPEICDYYPSNEEVRDFLRTFVSPPVINQTQQWATEQLRPLRKVIGALIEGAWAEHVVKLYLDSEGR